MRLVTIILYHNPKLLQPIVYKYINFVETVDPCTLQRHTVYMNNNILYNIP